MDRNRRLQAILWQQALEQIPLSSGSCFNSLRDKSYRGTGGVTALKSYDKIIFLDIYNAVECNPENELFHFLENPNEKCPVGRNIHNILDDKLSAVQRAMESELSKLTLQHIIDDAKAYVKKI